MKYYTHPRCSTCKKADSFLEEKGIEVERVDITEHPPSKQELLQALKQVGEIKKLFNTSGTLYRSLGLKERLPLMTDEEALEILSSQGMLVKRPFLVSDKDIRVGFKAHEWDKLS